MPDLYISWSEYHQKIEQLAAKIYEANWDFNQIVCIAKGGLRIGDILCRIYRKPLAILVASSYGGPENRVRGAITFSRHLAMTTEGLWSRVLLVDDLVESGISLRESINWLQHHTVMILRRFARASFGTKTVLSSPLITTWITYLITPGFINLLSAMNE
jgi:hypoxanthine phosphoribosyltransferase